MTAADSSSAPPPLSPSDPSRTAWGDGFATVDADGVLDVWFPSPALGLPDSDGAALTEDVRTDDLRGVRIEPRRVVIDLDAAPVDAADVYLRLHLLSWRIVPPHGLNLEGIFGLLRNVAWTNLGPVAAGEVDAVRARVRQAGGHLTVLSVDKFPRMVDYVVPSGVRIADGDRVRLGAHLAEGTTVMQAGFVNFNAGTLGASMVEGRISSGVVVGEGSDLGGSSSTLGRLSGGNTQLVSIGQRSLLGANSGISIAIGDDCVVEAGLFITAGTKVTLPDGTVVKARELSGQNGLLFRRNSSTGAVEVVLRPTDSAQPSWGGLNAALHSNT